MRNPAVKLLQRPASEIDISELVEQLIRGADAVDVLPTPLDDLVQLAKVTEVYGLPEPDEKFLQRLSVRATEIFKSGYQKVRGISDLRRRVIYTPTTGIKPRIRFIQGHELGHQVMPWHNVDGGYLDRDKELSPAVKKVFEIEANFFSADVIFQGRRFRAKARDYRSNFDSMFHLADMHGASYQATIWRFVEEQDEAIGVAYYYPTAHYDNWGNKTLKFWNMVPSPKFRNRFGNITLPKIISSNHPWAAARNLGKRASGNDKLVCGGKNLSFGWEAWWNGYALSVLIRRKPALHLLGTLGNTD